MVLVAPTVKTPLPLVPALAVVTVITLATSGFFFYQASRGSSALAAATAEAGRVNEQLAAARRRIGELEQEIAVQQAALASALRTLPVEVRFRVADGGLAAVFENHLATPITLGLASRRARTGEYAHFELVVPAAGSAYVSEKEGWAFRSGDTLTLTSGDYRPVSLAVP